MSATLVSPITAAPSAPRAIAWGGLLAGIGDITQALIVFGMPAFGNVAPLRIFQSIAVGVLGRSSFQGGLRTATLGLMLHFLIATIWAAVYYLASRKLRMLVDHPVICGLLFGVVVFLFMYLVVQPLSLVHRNPSASLFTTSLLITGWLGHPLLVGLPIALMTRRYGR